MTIDGPAGSGKSTTARGVAQQLDFVYLDTGAMYRAVALAFLRANAGPSTRDAEAIVPGLELDLRYEEDQMHVFLNGADVTDEIRTQDVGTTVSDVSALQRVRERMVEEQRRIGKEKESVYGGVVLDGRDTGTVVFPDADVKIFLVADLEERARRRRAEYREQGEEVGLQTVQEELRRRDEKDRTRELAPLREAEEAARLDTTSCTIEEQIQFVVDRVKAATPTGT